MQMVKRIFLIAAACLFGWLAVHAYKLTRPLTFYIVTPSYNNEQWCIKNLEAVVQQEYPHWKMVIVNDCSTDRTSELLHAYLEEHQLQERVLLVDNKQRCGACRNIYDAIHGSSDEAAHSIPEIPDDAVVVIYDGDDWFAHNKVLSRLAQEYQQSDVWLTYGNFKSWPETITSCCSAIPDSVMRQRKFRNYRWVTSHVRTFYAWLFKKIQKHDLLYKGAFLPVSCDIGIMLPMLEMASNGHIRYIREVLYVYNIANTLNDYKIRLPEQLAMEKRLRGLPRYVAL